MSSFCLLGWAPDHLAHPGQSLPHLLGSDLAGFHHLLHLGLSFGIVLASDAPLSSFFLYARALLLGILLALLHHLDVDLNGLILGDLSRSDALFESSSNQRPTASVIFLHHLDIFLSRLFPGHRPRFDGRFETLTHSGTIDAARLLRLGLLRFFDGTSLTIGEPLAQRFVASTTLLLGDLAGSNPFANLATRLA